MKVFDQPVPFKEKFYGALSNLFLLMFLKDNERSRTRGYYVVLVVIYFLQICGFMCTLSSKVSTDTYTYYLFEFLKCVRILPIISSIQSGFIPLVVLALIFVFECYIIYCAFSLSLSNIKDDCDVMKRQDRDISSLQLFLEHQKWIYCLPKFDLMFASFFCSSIDGPISNTRCNAIIQFSETGYLYRGTILFLFFLVLSTSIIISMIIALIYHNPEFNAVNRLKSRYSVLKSVEPFLEIGIVLFSYFGSVALVFVVAHIFGIFLMIEYFLHFPLVDKNISDVYGWMISVFEVFTTLFLIREYFTFIEDKNYVIIFLLLISLSYGTLKVIWNKQFIFAMTLDPNKLGDFPSETCLYLEKLCELFDENYTSMQSKLLLFGTLQLHKNSCKIIKCPCKNEELNKQAGEEKPTVSGGMIIDLGRDIKIRGIDFSRICTNEILFERWFMSFIDFSFEILIAHLIKKNEEQICQEVCLRYWFFLIKFKKNQIKALYQNKVMTTLIINKNTFFATVERSLTNLIENKLKERDKAHSYSYRQKDRSDASNNIKFEKLVLSETKKDDMKKLVGAVMKEKIEFINNLIKGFQNVNLMSDSTVNLITQITRIEKGLQEMIIENSDNIYFLKLLALIKSFLVFDPLFTRKIETELLDLYNKEKSMDSTMITSLTILSGNVGSVIASFKTEKDSGKILKRSERIPQIFGYERGEFQNKVTIYLFILAILQPLYFININRDRVKDLIPDCISLLHDSFLQRLIQTGVAKTIRSYRTMFAKNKKGFIFLCKLFINYYFLKQDDFAFSALIIKVQTHSNYLILNEQGYIEDMTEGVIEIMKAEEIDMSYFKQCHVSIYIPQFLDFIESYDPNEEYAFLKYRTDFPKDASNFTSQFINHHRNFNNKWNVDREAWRKNLMQFIKGKRSSINSFESIINIRIEEFEGLDKVIRLFIVEIEKMMPWDDSNSLLTGSTRNTNRSKAEEDNSKVQNEEEKSIKNNGPKEQEHKKLSEPELADQEKEQKQIIQQNKEGNNKDMMTQKSVQKYKSYGKQLVPNQQLIGQQNLHIQNYDEDYLNLSSIQSENGEEKAEPNQISVIKEQCVDARNLLMTTTIDDSNAFLNVQREHFQDQFEKLNDTIQPVISDRAEMNDVIVKDKFDIEANYGGITLSNIDIQNQDQSPITQPQQQYKSQFQKNNTLKNTNLEDPSQKETDNFNILNSSQMGNFRNEQEKMEEEQKENNQQAGNNSSDDDDDKKRIDLASVDTDLFQKEEINQDIKNQLRMNKNQNQDVGNENQSQTSINSSETSTIKKIVLSTESNKTPLFLIALYTVFSFQFVVFIGVVIVLTITISNNFEDYTTAINEMGRSSKMLTPVCQTLLTTDFLCLQNMNLMARQGTNINQFMTDNISDGFSDYINSLYSFLNEQIVYNYQKTFYEYQINALIQASSNEFDSMMYFTEFLKKVSESIFQLRLKEIQDTLIYTNDQRFLLTNNIKSMYDLFFLTQQEITRDLLALKDNIIKVNITSVVLGTLLIALSFIFICSPYQQLKANSERILQVISRMSEQEAEVIISGLNFITTQLFSLNDDYLHIDFSNLSVRDDQHIDGNQHSSEIQKQKNNQSKGHKKKSTSLSDRIGEPKIKFNAFFYILVILCIMSTSFFIAVFVYMQTFPTQFDPPSDRYQFFLEGSLKFSTMVTSHNILLINTIMASKNERSISADKINELIELRNTNLEEARQFFSEQYDILVNQQTTGVFQKSMVAVNQGNACLSDYFTPDQQRLCQTNQSGLLQKGLQYSITTMINEVINEKEFENNISQIEIFIQQSEYTENLITFQMIDHLLKSVISLFEVENRRIKTDFLSVFQWILVLGCFVYIVAFFLVMVYFLNKINQNYKSIKRGIQLIPFKRLCEGSKLLSSFLFNLFLLLKQIK